MSGPVQPWNVQPHLASPYPPSPRQSHGYAAYPPPQVPIFQVTTMRHIGALIFWFNQRQTVRGTYQQCDAALRAAQTQNLLLGWWSILSVLALNWIALAYNANARKTLNRDAEQAQAYAQWWHTYVGQGRM